MSRQKRVLPALSAAQREIMDIVWDAGEISAAGVLAILGKRRPVARNTVRTLLERMEEKGWLAHREEGRTHIYRAAHDRDTALGRKVLEVLDQACGGSPETLMAALIDYRGLDAAELKRIEALLAAAKARSRRKGDDR
jgi:predicted transcriptional regulator